MQPLRLALPLALALAACLATPASAGGPVVTLDTESFDELTSSGSWLLEFYAPWCGHCKALAPVFDEVALEAPDGTRLGKVDCTVEKALQQRFEVKGFPTLIFLRDGETRPYRGRRDRDSLLGFLQAMAAPPVQDVVAKNRKRRTADYAVNFVFAGGARASREYALFERAARRNQARQGFFFSEDEKLLKAVGAAEPAARGPVVVRLSEGGDNERFEGPWEEFDELAAWVDDHALPLVSELDASNFYDLTGSGKPAVFAVTNLEKPYSRKYLDTVFLETARRNRGRFVFANLDAGKFHQYVSQFNLDLDHGPTAFVFDFPNEQYWSPLPDDGHSAATQDGLEAFLDLVHRGEISARTVGAWWSPVRLFKWFERWVSQFTDTQLMMGSAAFGVVLLLLVFWLFCTGLGDLEPPPGAKQGDEAGAEGAAGGDDAAAAPAGADGLRRRVKDAPRVVDDDSDESD